MLADVLGIPDQIRDAFWRIDSAHLSSHESRGLLVAGMGGSAIGADLARGVLSGRLAKPFIIWRDYGLPSWITPEWGMLASSYSGETEETLSAFQAAGEIGMYRWVTGTGGTLGRIARDEDVDVIGLPGLFQPRAAVAYMLVGAVRVAHLAGIAPDIRDEMEAAATFIEKNLDRLQEQAAGYAEQIGGHPVVVYGAGATGAGSRRWVSQINENAKQFAFAAQIPEANHNLTEAWARGADNLGAIFLHCEGQRARDQRRMMLTRDLVKDGPDRPVLTVECEGESPSERVLWCIMLGDLVSLEMARLRGVDPVPVEGIQELKRRLGESP